jgi:uncharacterized protein YqcC (DUF446 family)
VRALTEAPARLAALMDELEAELRGLGLWQQSPPPVLTSALPFCADVLRFTEWLQWVFVPRTRALLDAGGPLPSRSGIRPMAEEVLAGCDWDSGRLIALLGRVDQVINCIAPIPRH